MRPSRRLGYRLDVGFEAQPNKLNLELKNHGELGVHLQARSLTVPGASLQLHDRRRRQARAIASEPGDVRPQPARSQRLLPPLCRLSERRPSRSRCTPTTTAAKLKLRLIDGGSHSRNGSHSPTVVNVADAYGPDRQVRLHGTEELTIDTRRNGGWYDIALTHPERHSFSYHLAGRLESGHSLTSDPQLGRSEARRTPRSLRAPGKAGGLTRTEIRGTRST